MAPARSDLTCLRRQLGPPRKGSEGDHPVPPRTVHHHPVDHRPRQAPTPPTTAPMRRMRSNRCRIAARPPHQPGSRWEGRRSQPVVVVPSLPRSQDEARASIRPRPRTRSARHPQSTQPRPRTTPGEAMTTNGAPSTIAPPRSATTYAPAAAAPRSPTIHNRRSAQCTIPTGRVGGNPKGRGPRRVAIAGTRVVSVGRGAEKRAATLEIRKAVAVVGRKAVADD